MKLENCSLNLDSICQNTLIGYQGCFASMDIEDRNGCGRVDRRMY